MSNYPDGMSRLDYQHVGEIPWDDQPCEECDGSGCDECPDDTEPDPPEPDEPWDDSRWGPDSKWGPE